MISLEKYIEKLNNDLLKVKTYSALETLKQVDSVINYHDNNYKEEDNAIILNIFGLLQSIFVGIDSLYNLTLDLTKNKSNININQNITLNKLKFIRNDIVGHPINRKYGLDSVGYSIIKTNNLDYNFFEYDTYLKKGKSLTKINQKVDLSLVKQQYLLEKDIIINHLSFFINKKKIKTNIDKYINELIINTNLETIEKIEEEFYKSYGKMSNNRLIWRLNLIKEILTNDYLKDSLGLDIEFILLIQINKLIEINNELENNNQQQIKIKTPLLFSESFKYLKNNKELDLYLKYLHDDNSTYYKNDLEYLIETVTNNSLLKLLNILNNTNDRNLIYLIGSTLKSYKKY